MVNVQETSGITLKGSAIARTTLAEYAAFASAIAGGKDRGVAMVKAAASTSSCGAGGLTESSDLPGGSNRAFV